MGVSIMYHKDSTDTMHARKLNYWHADVCESQDIAIKLSVFCKLGVGKPASMDYTLLYARS